MLTFFYYQDSYLVFEVEKNEHAKTKTKRKKK